MPKGLISFMLLMLYYFSLMLQITCLHITILFSISVKSGKCGDMMINSDVIHIANILNVCITQKLVKEDLTPALKCITKFMEMD